MQTVEKAGGIVLNAKGEVLLVTSSSTGRETLPKGGLEPGESYQEAALREIMEESGLKKVAIIRELGIIERPGFTDDNHQEPSVIKRIHIYLCKTDELDLMPTEKDVKRAYWVDQNDVASTLSWPEEADFFERHRADLA